MTMKRCDQGHDYDAGEHELCPVCGGGVPDPDITNIDNNDVFYTQAWDEINDQNKTPNKALWAKAFAFVQGDEKRTQAKYIELRVAQLQAQRQEQQRTITIPVSPVEQPKNSSKEIPPPYKKINPDLFTIFLWVGVFCVVLGAFSSSVIDGSIKALGEFAFIIGIGCIVIANIYFLSCLYRCWSILQKLDIARTSPGKAVGFLFIPFFNVYWAFVAFTGLASDANDLMYQNHITGKINRKLSIAHSILAIIPFLNFICLITSTILIYQYADFYNTAVDNWNEISRKSFTKKVAKNEAVEIRTTYVAIFFIIAVVILILAAIITPQFSVYKSKQRPPTVEAPAAPASVAQDNPDDWIDITNQPLTTKLPPGAVDITDQYLQQQSETTKKPIKLPEGYIDITDQYLQQKRK